MCSAQECLGEGREAAGMSRAVAGARQIRSKSQIGAAARDIRSSLARDFTDYGEGAAEFERHPAAAAIQAKTSAASGWQIAPNVVIVEANLHPGAALRQRGPGNYGGESESQKKHGECLL